jgi:cysteine synthase
VHDGDCLIGLELMERRAAMVERLLEMPEGSLEAFAGIFGISGICNVLGAIRLARHLNLGPRDNVVTVATDGFDRYPSVLGDLKERCVPVNESSFEQVFRGGRPDEILDVRGADEKRRLFQYKEEVWSRFHYSHAYLESMKSQVFWDREFQKVAAIDRALTAGRK